jgi:hypothetical protein
MYRTTCFAFLFFITCNAFAQKDSVDALFTFRITDYTVRLDDSTTIVQIALPDAWPMIIPEKQIGILKHRYEQGVEYDTNMIGWGRCYLVKDEWHYFAIHQQNRKPEQGDLLVTKCRMPKTFTGLLFNLARNDISLIRVDENQFYNSAEVFYMGPKSEQDFLDSMVADIRFTGKAMLLQNSGKDQSISGGLFHGKKLFAAMQRVKRDDVEKFLKYVNARPVKYAGNVWKISEIFATWMVSKTPEVIEDGGGQE